MGELHVDRYAVNPLTGERRFIARIHPDQVATQEREGWATYTAVSEPHTMAPTAPKSLRRPPLTLPRRAKCACGRRDDRERSMGAWPVGHGAG